MYTDEQFWYSTPSVPQYHLGVYCLPPFLKLVQKGCFGAPFVSFGAGHALKLRLMGFADDGVQRGTGRYIDCSHY